MNETKLPPAAADPGQKPPRKRARTRLSQAEIDRHHDITIHKNIWIAALAALPPTILALATLMQSMGLEKKVDGRLTQLLETTRTEAAATAALREKTQQAATARQDANKPPAIPIAPTTTTPTPQIK